MPVSSEAQRRFMYAVKEGAVKKKGLSKEKAEEFIEATPKDKKLPEKKKPLKKRIQEKLTKK